MPNAEPHPETNQETQPWLRNLNPAQFEAVTHITGPLLVVAGAGSGKTRVLTRRIAHLLNDTGPGGHPHARPQEILAITFTNKAAAEMRERVNELIGDRADQIWVMTFHAACARILRMEADKLGFQSSFTIYDQGDQVRLIKQCIELLDKDPKRFTPAAVHHAISNAKNRLEDAEAYRRNVSSFVEEAIAEIFELYDKRLRESNAMDFDDMIRYSVKLLEDNDDVRKRWQNRFRFIMVDEYQDTNHAQYRMLKALTQSHQNIMCVGDADQSIYSWRGADIRNITSFSDDFPNAKMVVLDVNYRSTSHILEAANAVVRNNTQRLDKELRTSLGEGELVRVVQVDDEHEEARFIVRSIESAIDSGVSHGDIAVFYRTNAQSRVLEDMLTRTSHPYQVIGGPRFYERSEVKDAFAYLNTIVNPNDSLSIARIINVPKRGIGNATVTKLQAYANTYGETLDEALRQAPMEGSLNAGTLNKLAVFVELIDELRDFAQQSESVANTIEELYERSGLTAALQAEDTIESQGRLENLGELVNVAKEYDHRESDGSLTEFLQALSLQAQADERDNDTGLVTLMTIHNAKGLEYPIVYIAGMEEGLFPHSRSIRDGDVEEERRLAYVGITRAKTQLTILHTQSRSVFGKRQYSVPSRFISELPQDHIDSDSLASSASSWGSGASYDQSNESGATFGARGWQSSKAKSARKGTDDEFGTTFGAKSGTSGWGSSDGTSASGSSGLLFDGQASTGKVRKNSKHTIPDLSAGDNVLHSSFGEGTVIDVDGDLAVIRFSDGQERRLMLGYAPLTKL